METFSLIAIRLREERRQRRHGKRQKVELVQPSAGQFAHQGHRTDLPDERLVSHREPRWLDGTRFVWNGKLGAWIRSPAPLSASPPRKAPKTQLRCRPENVDRLLELKLRELADAGVRPEELTIVIDPRS